MIDYTKPKPLWSSGNCQSSIQDSSEESLLIDNKGSEYVITIDRSNWDSAHIGRNVYKISSMYKTTKRSNCPLMDKWESTIDSPSILWVRLASEAGEAIRALEQNGFQYVSGLVTFIWEAEKTKRLDDGIVIRKANLEDASVVGEIGSQVFTYDRLFLDPAIARDTAIRMYGDWSFNCVKDLCETVLVAEVKGEIAGFISLNPDSAFGSPDSRSYQRIVLIAVSSKHRRRGFGKRLIQAAKKHTEKNNIDFLLVGTSSANTPAQRLYCSSGFQPYYSEISMEKLLNEN